MYINRDKSSRAFKLNISRQGGLDIFLMAGGFLAARALVFDAASPFVLAYISAFLFKGLKFYGAAFFASLGIISSFRGEFSMKYLLAIIILCTANLFISIKPKMAAGVLQAASAAGATLIAGVVLLFLRTQGLYHLAINLLEAALVFALAIVLGKGIACVAPKAKRGPLLNEELVAIAVLAGVLAVGAADVSIWHFSLRYFFAVLIVLLSAQSGGAAIGAVCGVFLGFMLNITGHEYIYFAVLLAMAGFGAGTARVLGRLPSLGVFVATGLLCALYFDLGLLSLQALLSTALAGLAFYFLPKGFLLNIHSNLNPATAAQGEYVSKVKGQVVDRVYDFAAGYGKLAGVFGGRVAGRGASGNVVAKAVEELRDNFCENCHKFEFCWSGSDIAAYVKDLATKAEKLGRISIPDAPLSFSSQCVAVQDFITTLNFQLEKQKLSRDWEQKLTGARGLVAEQFSGLAAVMYDFAEELDASLNFRGGLEDKLIHEFASLGVEAESITVTEDKQKRLEVYVVRKNQRDSAKQAKEISKLISQVLGKKMELAHSREAGRMARHVYQQQQKYYVQSAVSKVNKNGAKESGDSFTFLHLKNGRVVAALSDGMGSGTRAKEESEAAIELLEELMERGFQKDIALRLINSALLIKSSEEFFSTLDICFLDANSGMAEFVKIGAARSYLLREGRAEAIGSWTLPVGILESIDVDVHERQLCHGDVVVMMTDGVTDSCKNENWVEELLEDLPKGSPGKIADYILEEARVNYGGAVGDDMTALVMRVTER